ncbi:hypothetical protein ACUW6O_001847 [Staphylococcus epidermidis]
MGQYSEKQTISIITMRYDGILNIDLTTQLIMTEFQKWKYLVQLFL